MLGSAPRGGMLSPHAGADTEHPGMNAYSPNSDSGPASGWSTALLPKPNYFLKSPFGSWESKIIFQSTLGPFSFAPALSASHSLPSPHSVFCPQSHFS